MKLSCLVACVLLIAGSLSARAEHARIDLKLIRLDSKDAPTEAQADQEPPLGGRNERPLVKVKAGEPLALEFFLTNTYPHGAKKNVTVRYYVVREEKRGQKRVPNLKDGTITDGRVTMNFKPFCRVGSRVTFRIEEAGMYLLRVETLNTDSDHEHFSAIDVEVER
jgi:hypothetical protein